ncbi:hypothetical protein DL98DRAFT_123907 [Cadophora sp. DSE1049]|nr:hypothetical protein DL98DRAFT_123907 [Cadophora sp. DSE1049]
MSKITGTVEPRMWRKFSLAFIARQNQKKNPLSRHATSSHIISPIELRVFYQGAGPASIFRTRHHPFLPNRVMLDGLNQAYPTITVKVQRLVSTQSFNSVGQGLFFVL